MSTYTSRPTSDIEFQLEVQNSILQWYDEALAILATSLPLLTDSDPAPSELIKHRELLVNLVQQALDLEMHDLHALADQQLEDIELTIAMG